MWETIETKCSVQSAASGELFKKDGMGAAGTVRNLRFVLVSVSFSGAQTE